MNRLILIFTLFLFSFQIHAQKCDIRNLVFEGAGIRGIAYAGVIEQLDKDNKLVGIEKVGGTSAGAITALMVSLGYSSGEIADLIASTKFNKFNDGRFLFFGGLVRLNKMYGWYRGDAFTKWLSDIIESKTGNPDITFEELSQKGYKDLYVTGTCLNKQKLIVFSKESYPRMKIKDAVRISMSIPFYFKAVLIDSTGAVHKKADPTQKLDVVVDGGLLGNFPIFLFDQVLTDSTNRKHRIPDFKTLGIRIDSDLQIQNDSTSRELASLEIKNMQDYVSAFYVLILENLNRNELTEEDWARSISVSSVGITPRIKRLSPAQKERLINSGREATSGYLGKHCSTNQRLTN
ncbi:patatin-like phospholipase family protein [Telluribacter sp.]|jgi:NTE family protein|uniref:patatin-like phospholipase family protein n=1 Tax=Telluribacter sp. TaxID=1978767 RepID=UPI002E14DC46|nr:patatin-like phospholipase family protein [Telluribacter sp.]